MKKYSTTIAARKLVGKSLALGTSRHQVKSEEKHLICGVSTAHAHTRSLKAVGDWMHSTTGKHLKNLNEDDALVYLTARALTVGQSAVDLDRQAINFHLLYENPIPFVASTIERKLTNRAYTEAQIDLLIADASEKMQFSIRVAADAGLRAMELITIAPADWLEESTRDAWSTERFLGRENDVAFVVRGKGGLYRQVRLSPSLAEQLMMRVRPFPITVVDRKVTHKSFFDLTSGVNFSQQFSSLSKRVLGMSNGGHGLRHTFAQSRLRDLMCRGLSFEDALRVLSNELGHFSSNNTFAYLRD
jgi:integrase